VQIYESTMLDNNGQVTYTLLRAASYVKDNRILPAGFDKAGANPDIAVYGLAADDANFIGGFDQVTYLVDTQGFSGPFTITIELLYQSVSYQFAQDLFQDSHSLITLFNGLYQEADKLPTLLVSVERSVP
jgi:hypothetical protein